ncbi:S41 family peptidase [Clostridium sp. WILCCON 0269]|uniref:S41 family peptidase n=1 Tax=Candidatus Clostridium eludens TaxID=3381663 RepID=A0ABW8SRQ6_9CLOT
MNKFIKINFCFLLISLNTLFTGCQSEYLGGDRNAKWQKDLSYMQKALPKKHVDLFLKINEEQFNTEVNTLKNSVDKLNDDQILVGIHRIVASIGDTHTSLYKEALTIYPIQFYYFKEGIYVVNTIPEYKKALYSKLVKINGMNVQKIQETILPLIVNDNEAVVKKNMPKYLMNAEILHGLNIVSNIKSAVFTFENNEEQIFDLNINAINSKNSTGKFIIKGEFDTSYPLYMQQNNLNYWYKYIYNEKTLYFKYNKCEEDDNSKTIEDFTTEMIKFMDTHAIDKFVIDIRDNSGGSDKYINPIIDWIKDKKLNNKDHLFVIVGRNTFSSAIINAVTLKKETNATFIGEETSGKPNHYGSVKSFILPNSRIQIQYSTQFNKTSTDNSSTFTPDKIIEVSIEDYLNKKDPALNYILKK